MELKRHEGRAMARYRYMEGKEGRALKYGDVVFLLYV